MCTVPLETMGTFVRGKTSSLPIIIAARIHRGGTKTATAAKTKATESRGELEAVKIQ